MGCTFQKSFENKALGVIVDGGLGCACPSISCLTNILGSPLINRCLLPIRTGTAKSAMKLCGPSYNSAARFRGEDDMSTWMIFCSIWALTALCVVFFIRGAHPHIERPEGDSRDNGNDMTVGGLTVARVRSSDRGNS